MGQQCGNIRRKYHITGNASLLRFLAHFQSYNNDHSFRMILFIREKLRGLHSISRTYNKICTDCHYLHFSTKHKKVMYSLRSLKLCKVSKWLSYLKQIMQFSTFFQYLFQSLILQILRNIYLNRKLFRYYSCGSWNSCCAVGH